MSSKKNVKYKCPFCDKRFNREDLIIHIENNHEEMIPEDFTAFRYVFNYVNKKPPEYHGRCTECGGSTDWDENKGRYNRQCNNPACKASFIKKFESNMLRTRGVTRISSTIEGQEKMLANRKISGKYKFKDGVEKVYTGSYELEALKFMDQVMNIPSSDIICPGPVLYYEYNGEKHFYITDFYYVPYDLIIEVKDGGSRPNKREMPEYRAKQIAKEKFIIKNTNYNYLRLTDNDLSQLLSVFADLKMQMVDNSNERVIHVNESMNALSSGYIPGIKDSGSVYIVNYMKNNVFSGEPEEGYGVSDNCKLTNLICRNKEGVLCKAPDDFLYNAKYDVYGTDIPKTKVSRLFKDYMGKFVEEGFIYETLFRKKLYSYDQIKTESSVYPIIDFYYSLEKISEITKNSLLYNNTKDLIVTNELSLLSLDVSSAKDEPCAVLSSFKNGEFVVESQIFPDLLLRSDKEITKESLEYKLLTSISLS